MAVGSKCTWWEGGGSIKLDMRLVVEEICELFVDIHELLPSIESQDVVCGVRGCGSIHCVCRKADC